MSIVSQIAKNLKNTGILDAKNNAIIHNRFVLYFIFFIALADLYYLTMAGDFFSVAVFILIGFLTSFFSKNMMIIFFIALTVTNILKYGTKIRHSEGFEEGSTTFEGADESDEDNKPDKGVAHDAAELDTKGNAKKESILKPTEKVTTKEILSKLNKIVEIMKN